MVGAVPLSRGGFRLAGARAASHVWVPLVLGLIFLPGSWARSGGRVSGTVRDSSNALIPKASVRATNTQTGAEQQMLTDGKGTYSFPELPVGTYDVVVECQGFKSYR